MPKFRKKPVVIEAVRWNAGKWSVLEELRIMGIPDGTCVGKDGALSIPTLEGVMRGDVGDWIIKGVKGEFYPCKPDIFEATYDPVEE